MVRVRVVGVMGQRGEVEERGQARLPFIVRSCADRSRRGLPSSRVPQSREGKSLRMAELPLRVNPPSRLF